MGPRRFPWPVTLTESAVSARGLACGPRTVTLRAVRADDESAWRRLRLDDDARLTPWEATLPPGSPETLGSFREYARTQNRLARRGEAMPFVLVVDGAFAGQVTVSSIRWGSLQCASLGYWIGSPWEGRGVMTLAVAMVLDHLLGPQVGLHRVEIDVRPNNARSLAVCRRLGLRREGLRRGLMHINGRWADHVTFAVVAEEVQADDEFVRRLG
ncbi:GNAT family N-acetyltransferase [Actinomyces qiguomingii]|uniref:GNAT family N-acetyltransferase n=1 Tax=Actinomyces qiguomingii TaxID=2057800 RepID=UPI001E5F7AFD|nr:GNAT family protein [Actinomyces qiguomingii]